VPAQAFRRFDLSCRPIDECSTVFFSSGTTSEQSSRHWMDPTALAIYELSLKTNFYHHFPNDLPIWAVMPSPVDAPNSSLTHMLGSLGAVRFAGSSLNEFAEELARTQERGHPIILFGTAFGLMELISINPVALPKNSLVIETGGFKGRHREIDRVQFYGHLRAAFDVADKACFSEYGMCELTSQFYSQGSDGALYGPHWIRTRCIDPLTQSDCQPNEVGLLRHYDLANLNSVSAVQTQDRATVGDDGGFKLLGRASDAELRGCSLTAEELWSPL